MAISVVIPVRNDESVLRRLLVELEPLRGPDLEVVVVEADDSFIDTSVVGEADRWLRSDAGRACQLQHGAQQSKHDYLWFVHADSQEVTQAAVWLLEHTSLLSQSLCWGRFDIRFDDGQPLLKMVAWFMNLRSRLTSIATGDQGIYVHRDLLEAVGGWPQQLLMEDVELSGRLRRRTSPSLPPPGQIQIVTSARRWRANGIWRTIVLMWALRIRYALGGDPAELHRSYYLSETVGDMENESDRRPYTDG